MRRLPEQIVPYQRFDGHSGLSYDNGQLTAWLDGTAIASAPVVADSLDEILGDYRALTAFPAIGFAYTQPRRYRAELAPVPGLADELTFTFKLEGDEALDGEEMLVYTQFVEDPIFAEVAEIPAGQVCHDQPAERGWRIQLPGPLMTHPDPVVRKRCAQAVEHYLHAIGIGRAVRTPYVWHFTNVMDSVHPMWQLNLPRLALAGER